LVFRWSARATIDQPDSLTFPTVHTSQADLSCANRTRTGEGQATMSRRNGDRARFQKERKRKMRRRERLQALVGKLRADKPPAPPDSDHDRS